MIKRYRLRPALRLNDSADPSGQDYRLTIGSSDRGSSSFGEPRRESMIAIKQLRLTVAQARVAQPHR
jgi:hypothetical protein